MNYTEEINFLKEENPNAENIFQAQDKDYIWVITIIGYSRFGKNDKNEEVIIPVRKTDKYHVDTIRLKIILKKLEEDN